MLSGVRSNNMTNTNNITANVILARKPDRETESMIEKFIQAHGCKKVQYEIDPSIIGGIIIYIGDTVFDGSVRSRLDKIKNDVTA